MALEIEAALPPFPTSRHRHPGFCCHSNLVTFTHSTDALQCSFRPTSSSSWCNRPIAAYRQQGRPRLPHVTQRRENSWADRFAKRSRSVSWSLASLRGPELAFFVSYHSFMSFSMFTERPRYKQDDVSVSWEVSRWIPSLSRLAHLLNCVFQTICSPILSPASFSSAICLCFSHRMQNKDWRGMILQFLKHFKTHRVIKSSYLINIVITFGAQLTYKTYFSSGSFNGLNSRSYREPHLTDL